jgi:hypothetical protein
MGISPKPPKLQKAGPLRLRSGQAFDLLRCAQDDSGEDGAPGDPRSQERDLGHPQFVAEQVLEIWATRRLSRVTLPLARKPLGMSSLEP